MMGPIKHLEAKESSGFNLIIDKKVHFSLLSFQVRMAHSGHLPF